MLKINLLGPVEVFVDGKAMPLPSSRKTRALLGYLALCATPQRRDRLCELFWDVPDDPRGSLRWSLSKLRPALNAGGRIRLVTDRERVRIETDYIDLDLHRLRDLINDEAATPDALAAGWALADQVLMEDCELSNQDYFTAWLTREREDLQRLKASLARRLAQSEDIPREDASRWADSWLDNAPFDKEAAQCVVSSRRMVGQVEEAAALAARIETEFEEAGLKKPVWATAPDRVQPEGGTIADDMDGHRLASRQKVRFVKAQDDVSLAWASIGDEDSPPLVKAANWLTHLELDWEAPIWSPLFRNLAQDHHLIRYDERGCGLSDWEVDEISQDTFVSDLEEVVDSAGLDRFPLLGISQGAAVSIEYAARHPERVTHLILFGGYPAGWRHTATPAEVREREAVMVLTETGWGRSDPTYRNLFSQTFMPDATPEELKWFDEFQRRTTSPENAVRFLHAFADLDVRDKLSSLSVPTLVIHSRGDRRIPVSTGRELAAAIPNAEFVSLESNNHLLIGREPAARTFLSVVREFLRA
ncbi:alpha/beta fold hydrolase [Parvularcula flava]|uniref:Alpha/beta fold hydrolase n=1 Tax=Aquisalinus luteolus TaxID=1566827 RepID=A0A8J3A3A1_9PROT|nr:alpha/beta hydrolase [Aquisalinus luteolus]NHK28892.1 alpha/beta fold hydrolase [Aquisalinus luteolus]GGH99831.1 hypothetical protein GCM10011355_26720 [Aquisalinus luteolus]